MSAAVLTLLGELHRAGGQLHLDAVKARVTAPAPLPDDLMARLRAAKPDLLRLHPIIDDWRDFLAERAAHREYDGAAARVEAEHGAWDELEARVHLELAEPAPYDRCAGCGELLGSIEGLLLSDGAKVHFGGLGIACLETYNDRWRAAARDALMALGLTPPGQVASARID